MRRIRKHFFDRLAALDSACDVVQRSLDATTAALFGGRAKSRG